MTQVDANEKANGALKMTSIMETLCSSGRPLSVREVEESAAIPRSTAHRLLLSLESCGWAFRDPLTNGYRPGIRFLLLSSRSSLYDALIRTAEPEMTDLMRSTGNTVTLSVREGCLGFCIFTVEPATPVKFTARRGLSVPLHAGATGKILLAYAPEEIRSRVLSSPLPSPLGGDDADPVRLREDLERIRAQGYAVSREEWMSHAGDISVPLFDGRGIFVAQLGVAGIAESIFGGFDETLRRLLNAAQTIRNKL